MLWLGCLSNEWLDLLIPLLTFCTLRVSARLFRPDPPVKDSRDWPYKLYKGIETADLNNRTEARLQVMSTSDQIIHGQTPSVKPNTYTETQSTLSNLPEILGPAMSEKMREVWKVLRTVDKDIYIETRKKRLEVEGLAREVESLRRDKGT